MSKGRPSTNRRRCRLGQGMFTSSISFSARALAFPSFRSECSYFCRSTRVSDNFVERILRSVLSEFLDQTTAVERASRT